MHQMPKDFNKWVKDPDGIAEDYTLQLICYHDEDSYWMHADVKSDGCVNLSQARNVPFSKQSGLVYEDRDESACDEHIHICNLSDYIKKLQELEKICIEHFNNEHWKKENQEKCHAA